MNLDDPRHPWSRLVAAARQAPEEQPATAPYGFATRMAARGLTAERRLGGLFDRFALRALGVACLLAAASIAANYAVVRPPAPAAASDEELPLLPAEDPVSILLDA